MDNECQFLFLSHHTFPFPKQFSNMSYHYSHMDHLQMLSELLLLEIHLLHIYLEQIILETKTKVQERDNKVYEQSHL